MNGEGKERQLRARVARDPSDLESLRELAELVGRDRRRKGEAVELWRRHAEEVDEPAVGEALLALARAQIEARQEAEAIETLKRCIQRSPRDIEAHDLLGEILRQAGQLEQAVDVLRTASQLDPQAVRPRVALVACLDALGRHTEASEELQSLQAQAGADPRVAGLVRELMHRRG